MAFTKVLVSLMMVWLCFRGVDAGEVWVTLAGIPLGALAACLACTAGHALLSAWRWRLVCHALGVAAPQPRDALRWTSLSVSLSQALPSTVGGDAYRIGAFARHHGGAAAARSVIHDRLNGLWVLGALAAAGGAPALWLAGWRPGLILLCVAGALLVLALPPLLPLALLAQEARAFRALLHSARLMWTCVAIHGMTLGAVAALAAGLHPESALWWQAVLVAPAVMLAAALPVSLGGWGVREGAMVIALGLFGVATRDALALSVAYGLVLLATGALGALLWAILPQSAQAHRTAAWTQRAPP
jgi:hypothetical protein